LWRKVCHLPLSGIELLLTRVFCAVFANAVWRCGWSVSACSPLRPTCLTRVAICRVVPANLLPESSLAEPKAAPTRFPPHNNRSALKHPTAASFPAVSATLIATCRHSNSPKRWTRELTCRGEDFLSLPLSLSHTHTHTHNVLAPAEAHLCVSRTVTAGA
jgi:hypothetical protein